MGGPEFLPRDARRWVIQIVAEAGRPRRAGALAAALPLLLACTTPLEPVAGAPSIGDVGGPNVPDPARVVVAPTEAMLDAIGARTSILAIVVGPDDELLSQFRVQWSTEQTEVVEVSPDGVVTALAEGTAIVFATAGRATGEARVLVLQVAVSIEISASSLELGQGESDALTAQTRDANDHLIHGRDVTWTSSDAGVATVSEEGVVTGVAPGSATVAVGIEGLVATAVITVSPS